MEGDRPWGMNLTLAEYQRLALRTEAGLDPDALTDVQKSGIEIARHLLTRTVIPLGETLDQVKRAAIYGKAGRFEGPPTPATLPLDRRGLRLLHAALGVASEVGELAMALDTTPLDVANLKEEIGDVLWYLAVAADALGTDLGALAEANVRKLAVRFKIPPGLPEGTSGYQDTHALHRDLDAERVALEGAPSLDAAALLTTYFQQTLSLSTDGLHQMVAQHPAVIQSAFPSETIDALVRQILDGTIETIIPYAVARIAPQLTPNDLVALAARVGHSPERALEQKIVHLMATTGCMNHYVETLAAVADTVLTPILGNGTRPLPEG